jgi:hypothetical protein
MKTCIFGGTFDPPHIGHLLIAQTIIESENFDRLIFLPRPKAARGLPASRLADPARPTGGWLRSACGLSLRDWLRQGTARFNLRVWVDLPAQ